MSAQNALFQSKKMTSPMQPNFNMEPRNRHIPISKKMEIKSRGYSKPTSFQIFFLTNFQLFNQKSSSTVLNPIFWSSMGLSSSKFAPVPPPAMPRKPPNTRRVPRQSLARRRRGRCYLGQDGSGPSNHQYHGKNMGNTWENVAKLGNIWWITFGFCKHM